MSVLIPPAKNYQSPLISVPSRWQQMPSEGARYMVAELLWATMGLATGSNYCISLNMAGQGAQTISQIVALSVDNSQCGADVVFIFPDSNQTYTVPAYTPLAVFPVFTGQTQFYANAIGVLSTDVTRMSVHNYMPPAVTIPVSVEQQAASLGSIPITGAGFTQIVPLGVNGTLQNLSLGAAVPNATIAYNDSFTFTDGAGQVLATANLAGPINSNFNGLILNQTALAKRFSDGIIVTQTGGFTIGGTASINLLYRIP